MMMTDRSRQFGGSFRGGLNAARRGLWTWSVLGCVCAASGQTPSSASVEVKRIPESNVVYKIQRGPYWQLGRAYAEIGRILAESAIPGPMYGKYLDDPSRVNPGAFRTEVGFIAPADFVAPEGFEHKTVAAHEAASLTVKGPYSVASRYHKQILDWIASSDYVAVGGVTELYPDPTGRHPVTELRVPVVRKGEVLPADASGVDVRESSPPSARETVRLDELLKERAYDRAAVRLIPSDADVRDRAWLVDVVGRLRVIREIVEARYAGEADEPKALLSAIVKRAAVSRTLGSEVASAPGGVGAFVAAERKAACLKTLDRYMVQAHLKKLAGAEVYDRLVAVLIEIDHVLHPTSTGDAGTGVER